MNISVGRFIHGNSRTKVDFGRRPHATPDADSVRPPEPDGHLDPDPGFSMQVSVQKRAIQVRVAGELDAYTAFLFTMALKRLERLEMPVTTVDLTDLEFIDSSGLAALREARERAERAGRTFGAERPNLKVRRFLTLAGEGRLLEPLLPYLTSVPSQPDKTEDVQKLSEPVQKTASRGRNTENSSPQGIAKSSTPAGSLPSLTLGAPAYCVEWAMVSVQPANPATTAGLESDLGSR